MSGVYRQGGSCEGKSAGAVVLTSKPKRSVTSNNSTTKVSLVSSDAAPERRDGDTSSSTVESENPPPASGPGSQSQPPARRSSLRPAPPDYRPSARDPSTLRPTAVVRAGNAESTLLHPDSGDPPPSRPSQTPLDRSAKEEPFALAEDYSANEAKDRITPLVIPPPPSVETLPPNAAAEVTTDGSLDLIPSSANATIRDVHQQEACGSTGLDRPATSERQKYRLVAVVLASMILVSAVLTVLHGGNRNAANPTLQVQAHIEPAPRQPASLEPSDVPPVAGKSNPPAIQPATAAELSAIAPAASALPDTNRVTLDLTPIDAKVYQRGRELPGPPFVFELEKGERTAVEAIRFGFVTAKVVIDDKKPVVHFGMLREHRAKSHPVSPASGSAAVTGTGQPRVQVSQQHMKEN